ncbi:MAG: riboflavin synthase subunit alpha, partial [Myxococcota bacterium]
GRGAELGASVAIDGVCQTVAAVEGDVIHFEAIQETLDKTTLGALSPGAKVSVERSARVGDEVGGHNVSGHIVGTGTIEETKNDGHEVVITIGVEASWMKYILPKGYVAIDGSSLTVGADVDARGRFQVYLIPETLRLTNLGGKRVGDRVNVELDSTTVAIVDTTERTVERLLREKGIRS